MPRPRRYWYAARVHACVARIARILEEALMGLWACGSVGLRSVGLRSVGLRSAGLRSVGLGVCGSRLYGSVWVCGSVGLW